MTPLRNPFDLPLVVPAFARPEVLAFLAVPVTLLVLVWLGRVLLPHRRLVLPLDRGRGGDGWGLWLLVTLADSLPPLLLMLVIVLLAGPLRAGPPKQKRSLTNIQFAVDVSGSMLAPFGDTGDRYDAAMKAVDRFLDHRKGDAFGLTFFGHEFIHWCPLTSDPSAVRCSIPFMRPDKAPPAFGGTAINKAVRGCLKELQRRDDGDKMILLITDGYSDDITGGAEVELAKELVANKVTLFGVIVAEGDPQSEMYSICRQSGGEAFRADDPAVLQAVFAKIDTMKPAKMSAALPELIDYHEPFAAAGLAGLLMYLLCLFGLRYTPW